MKFSTEEDYIAALIKERDDYLKANPHLQEFQDEIDGSLDGIVKPLDRAEKLNAMLVKKMATELLPAQKEVKKIQAVVKQMEKDIEIEAKKEKIDISLETMNI